jgi:hypothetical protein
LDIVRRKAKDQFFATRNETDPQKLEAAFAKGEYIVRELQAMAGFHKYRTMKKRYEEQ